MRLAALLMTVSLTVTGCATDGGDGDRVATATTTTTDGGSGPVGVVSASINQGNVALSADPDPPRAGAAITWTLSVANTSDDPLTLRFSSGQRGDVVLTRDTREVYRWSDDRAFTQALEEVTVAPGEEVVFDLAGELDVDPGVYEMTAALTAEPSPTRMEREIEVVEGA